MHTLNLQTYIALNNTYNIRKKTYLPKIRITTFKYNVYVIKDAFGLTCDEPF